MPAAFGRPIRPVGAERKLVRSHQRPAQPERVGWRGRRWLADDRKLENFEGKPTMDLVLCATTQGIRRGGQEGSSHWWGAPVSGWRQQCGGNLATSWSKALRLSSLAAWARGGHEVTIWASRQWGEARGRALTGRWRPMVMWSAVEGGGGELEQRKLGEKHRWPLAQP
jgi:hypothetical protein